MCICLFSGSNDSKTAYSKSLFITLKDHNCKEAMRICRLSQSNFVKSAAEEQGYSMNHVSLTEGDDFSSKPVQLVLKDQLDAKVRLEILTGLEQIKFADFDLKVVDFAKG